MNMDGFTISQDRFWTCTLTDPPAMGETVRVLNRDGCDVGKATWNSRSHLYFYGWAKLDKVPPHIKRRILENYPTEPRKLPIHAEIDPPKDMEAA